MNKRLKAKLAPLVRIQAQNPQYHVSRYSTHEQAIREHVKRGYGDGLVRVAGLLDQGNRI